MLALPPKMISPLSPKRASPGKFNPETCGIRYR